MTVKSLLWLAALVGPVASNLRAPRDVRTSNLPPETWMTTPQLIQYWGYPGETHDVQTEDGYILEVHRVTGRRGQFDQPVQKKTPVLMMHGYAATSECMVLREHNELAFMLANADFDVWIGNTRGNFYGKRHVSMSPREQKFWDFGWHENGLFDISAIIDYVLAITGQPSVLFFGHSMGGTALFALLSDRPDYNAKVQASFLAAPAVYFRHVRGAFHEVRNRLQWTNRAFKSLTLENPLTREPVPELCLRPDGLAVSPACIRIFEEAQGEFHDTQNNTYLPILLRHWPGGTSFRQLMHFAQLILRGDGFYKYDFGRERNLMEYGAASPPHYNVKNIVSPTFFFYSENDWQAHYKDIRKLAADIPGTAGLFLTPSKRFNHLDIMYDPSAGELVYKRMIEQMLKYR